MYDVHSLSGAIGFGVGS